MSAGSMYVILGGIQWTLLVSASAFIIGCLLGVPICAIRISKLWALSLIATSIIVVLRSIPPIVWLFVIYFGVGSGYLQVGATEAAIIALGIVAGANLAEIYRGALQSIHHGQFEAARTLNLPAWSRFYDVISPQLIRVALPSAATYLIGLLKDSAIASTVGVTEIAFQANLISRREFEGLQVFAFAGLLYIVISIPVALVARYTDGAMRARVAQ